MNRAGAVYRRSSCVRFGAQNGCTTRSPTKREKSRSPVTETLLILRGALPVFVTLTLCAALVVPSVCGPKLRLVGLRLTPGCAGGVFGWRVY